MVLYCIQHSSNIMKAIVHKFKYHPQDDAAFAVDSDGFRPDVEKIKYYQTPDLYELVRYGANSGEEIKTHIDQAISEFFKGNGLDPQQFSHAYVLFDTYNPFALYFELNSVKYMSVETSDNSFSDHAGGKAISRLMSLYPEAQAYNCLIRDMHLQDAQGESCAKAYLYSDKSAYNAEILKTDAEVFGYYESLIGLDEKHKRRLIEGCRMEQYNFDTALLLSSPFFANGAFSIYKSGLPFVSNEKDGLGAADYFYKTLIDYYFNDADFALKLPPESGESYAEAFSGLKQLPTELPMEMFLLLDKRFELVYPDLASDFEPFAANDFKVTIFGGLIFDFFKYIHFLFLAFTIISAFGLPEKITVSGIDTLQLSHFIDRAYKDFKPVIIERLYCHNVWDASFIIADPSEDFAELIKNAPKDCLIFVYGTCQGNPEFAAQEMTCSLMAPSSPEGKELQSFSWTVLSKNPELIAAVKDFSASYTLDNAGVTVQTLPQG